jgi:catechol 2,3-dioxygenase
MPAPPIDPGTRIGPVRLAVQDVLRVRAFYEDVIGLQALAQDGEPPPWDSDELALGGADGIPLVELDGGADVSPRARGASGLFHLALLYPSRAELARALRRVVDVEWMLDGASDHLVSEALYLSDPEGNGIELYRDRPREEWTHEEGGELRMATLPLDVRALLYDAPEEAVEGPVPAGTRMGHVHLQVADLGPAEGFYNGLLGFDVIVRGYPGALFLSAGGYHHHIGLNTWASRGGPPNAPRTRGLDRFTITLPSADAIAPIAARLADAGVATRDADGGGLLVSDPFGNDVLLCTPAAVR